MTILRYFIANSIYEILVYIDRWTVYIMVIGEWAAILGPEKIDNLNINLDFN